MSAGAAFDDLHQDVFDELAIDATWAAPSASPVPIRAVFTQTTAVVTDMGDIIDPRPSVKLQREVVGDKPQGRVTIDGAVYDLDRPVDGSGDEYVVHMHVIKDM